MAFSNLKKTLNLNVYIGFNTGRTTLINNEYISQKNPFFSPETSIQPKVIMKRFAISPIAEAKYDVSDPAWKANAGTKRQHIRSRPLIRPATPALSASATGLIDF